MEEQFYFFFPLLLYSALRSGRNLRIAAISLVMAAMLFRFGFRFLPVDTQSIGPSGGMYYATLTYADVFLFGCFAGWMAARGLDRSGLWPRVLRLRGTGTFLFASVVFLTLIWRGQLWYPYALYSTVLYGVTGAVFAAVILWAILSPDSWVSRLLRTGPMRALGVLSYGIYLWHPVGAHLVRYEVIPLMSSAPGAEDFSAFAGFCVYLGFAIGSAALSYVLIERPFLRLKERFVVAGRASLPGKTMTRSDWIAVFASVGGIALLLTVIMIKPVHGPLIRTRVVFLPVAAVQPIPPEAIGQIHAQYVPSAMQIPLGLNNTPPTRIESKGSSGQIFLVGDTGDVLRVKATGEAVRLVAQDRQRIRITNVGMWNQRETRLEGLDAVYRGGHWELDRTGILSSNPNNQFQLGAEAAPVPGFSISPSDAGYTIRRMEGPDGVFVRVTATRASRYLVLGAPLSAPDGVPVSIRGQIRAHGVGKMTLFLYDGIGSDGKAKTYQADADPLASWTTLVIQAPKTIHPGPAANFSLGLFNVAKGDWFDARELSLYLGVVP